MKKIGEMIRELRQKNNLTIHQLAEKSGVPWNTIARIERGEMDPQTQTVLRIILVMGCEISFVDAEPATKEQKE